MGEICDVCQRPKWDGGHALNERECSQSRGEVCRLHAALAAANARADGFKSALELASKAGEQTQRELEAALAAARRECERLRAALTKIRDECSFMLNRDIPWVRHVAAEALAAPADGDSK